MKTPSTSTILHLAGKMKRPTISRVSRAKGRARPARSLIRFGVIFPLLIATAFYTVSSASLRDKVSRNIQQRSSASISKAPVKTLTGGKDKTALSIGGTDPLNSKAYFRMLLPQTAPLQESVSTFQVVGGVCTTIAKDVFNLGEQVCARVANTPLRVNAPLRRVGISGTDGTVVATADVTIISQELLFTLPSSETSTVDGVTIDNRGRWSASINSTADNSTRAIAYFFVADPNNAAADLAIYNFSTSADPVTPGQSTGFFLWITNNGPDSAANVHVTQVVPPNMTFTSATAGNGPAFTCSESGGVVDCSPAQSLANGAISTFTINYTVNAGAPNTAISSDVNITSDTNDPRQASNTSSAKVEIRSAGAPPATCSLGCPSDITVTANATNGNGDPGAYVTYTGSTEVSGDCGTINTVPATGTFFPVGSTTVNVTSSVGGGSCSFVVTVLNTPPPTINCPANFDNVTAPDGACNATVDVGTPTTTGSGVTVEGVRSDGLALDAPYPAGTTTIKWAATDSSNRSVSCTQSVTVTVNDTQPPTITAPPDVDVSTPGGTSGSCGLVVGETELGTPTASDNCTVNVTRTGVPAGSFFPVGTTTITYTAKDGAGNTATATQKVTVRDTTPPIIVAPPDASYTCPSEVPAADPSQATAPFVDANGNIQSGPPSDNCSTPVVTVNESRSGTGSATNPLIILRTFTATDSSGNTASATQTITVADPIAPTISCPANIVTYLPLNSTATSVPINFAATASDNCGTPTITYSQNPGTNFPVGTTTVTTTATDAGGNTASCQFTVTVLYNFTGFFSPVINPPTVNVVNAGRAIPIKFSLSGNKGLNIFAPNSPASGPVACNSGDPATDLTDTVTAGSSSLSYDPTTDQYIYVWKTDSSWATTCRQLVVKLNDGSTWTANFKFK